MHVPDGFLDAPTSVATAGVAAVAVGTCLRGARRELDDRAAPLAGLTAAYVFAVQMLNFPVGAGTSGHLLGGALAAALVGPCTATLVITVVLVVQALLFGDGGLTALGTNITLIGVVGVWVGWVVMRAVLAVLPRRPASVVPAAAVGALVSVPAAALAFAALFAVGGTADVDPGAVALAMGAWHTAIGIGEAVITGLTVSAVVATRPDLVFAARGLRRALRVRTAAGTVDVPAGAAPEPARRRSPFLAVGFVAALVLAGVVSFAASAHPDGLEFVAGERGFLDSARDHLLGSSPLADYGEVGGVPVGVAGVLGVLVTVAVGTLVARWAAGRRRAPEPDDDRPSVQV